MFTSSPTRSAPEHQNVNDMWYDFKTLLQSLIDKHIPSKWVKDNRNRKPWVTKEVRSLIARRNRLFKKQRASKNSTDIKNYQKAKATVQRSIRSAHWQYIENIIEPEKHENLERPNKQKRFWRYIKSLKKESTGIAPLKHNGKLYNTSEDKANILNEAFRSFFTSEDTESIPRPEGDIFPKMDDIIVKEVGVRKLLSNLKEDKASGPDQLPARVLKQTAEQIAPYLTRIIQETLAQGSVPDDWKTANVSPIFKKGDKYDPGNYRPISLTCICCKINEHILSSAIRHHLDEHSILHDSQHGFRQRRSCETQLIAFIHDLATGIDKGEQQDIIILDFSKAFDKVPHERLLGKLYHYGIQGNTLQWIKSFLEGRSQRVLVEGTTSNSVPVTSGVPQGSVLGPLLFLAFINDIPDNITSKIRLFADDCIIYRKIKTDNDGRCLQEDLTRLATWEKKWCMSFNPEKCTTMRVTRMKREINRDYILKGHKLSMERKTKYLGVNITSNLDWKEHIDQITKKANSTIGFLRRNLKIRNVKTKASAYYTMVRPTLEYCSTAWNPYKRDQIDKIEMVQRRAARYVTARYHNTSSVGTMLDDLGWETLETRRKKIHLVMMYKIQKEIVDIPSELYLIPNTGRTRAGSTNRYVIQRSRTDILKHSFFPATTRTWNSLPAEAAEAPSLASFKRELSNICI